MKKYLSYDEIVEICQRINEHYLPDNNSFMDAVDYLLEQYTGENPKRFILEAFKYFLSVVDKEIRRIEKKAEIRPTCAKGCAHCCYFPIIITKLEAELMMEYIEHLPQKEEILGHLKVYFQMEDKKLQQACSVDFTENPYFKEQYISKQLPCPFLDLTTNTCKVYEVRPIPCRTYLNYCNPNVCAQSHIPNEPFSYEFFYEYYMQALNELIQELLEERDELGFNYPDDLFVFDYLPNFLRRKI